MSGDAPPCRHQGGHWVDVGFAKDWRCKACDANRRRQEDRRQKRNDTPGYYYKPPAPAVTYLTARRKYDKLMDGLDNAINQLASTVHDVGQAEDRLYEHRFKKAAREAASDVAIEAWNRALIVAEEFLVTLKTAHRQTLPLRKELRYKRYRTGSGPAGIP